ncbi:MAG: hypothetical protein V4685_18855, partial [Bacteroidota bacterium]
MKELYTSCILFLKRAKRLYAFIILLAVSGASVGQISLTTIPQSYGEDFNSYAGTAVSIPTGWTGSSTNYRGIGDGSGNSGGAWALGTGGEYCLGSLYSGTNGEITYSVSFTNNTGSTITSLTIAWNYEQWRYANTSGLNCTATGALAGNTTIDALDFTGTASGTNAVVTTTPVASFTLTGLSITNGSTFGISWITNGAAASGSDNGAGIDNFSLTVPTPCTNPSIGSGPIPATQQACLNLAPTNIVISASGTTPTYQWYSNTVNSNSGGTTVGAANGGQTNTYTPPTTVANTTYYYCIVSGCSQTVTSTTSEVVVNTPLAATISYPNTPFCSNAGTQTVIRTGASGGTYASTAGLTIDGTTGDINPATSTAGPYTVTYSLAATGGCPIQTATASITVTALPAATISYPAASFCKTAGAQTVTRTGTAGGTYTSLPAGLTINSGTGAITPSSSTEGDYTVTYTMTAPGFGCTVNQTTTTTVSIKSTSTVVSPAATQDLSPGVDGT